MFASLWCEGVKSMCKVPDGSKFQVIIAKDNGSHLVFNFELFFL